MSSFRLFGALVLLSVMTMGMVRAQDDKKDKDEEKAILQHKKMIEDRLNKASDEYRQFFKAPTFTHEFWAAVKFEMSVGKYELAGMHLKMMLDQKDEKDIEKVDKALVELEEVEGYYPFLRLQDVKKWSDYPPFQQESREAVQVLIKRLTAAVEKNLSDPERIKKFIARLDAPTPEERGYAFVQLQKSRHRAVPYLVETLRTNVGKPLHARVVQAYQHFHSDFMPPLLEILKATDDKDAQDVDLRVTLLHIFRKRGDDRCVPYLWHLSESKRYPGFVRDLARETLAYLLESDADKLPPSKIVLARMAEKYYQHKMKFEAGGQRFWKWDGLSLALAPERKNQREAEEFFGLRYARESLDLDPGYKPAQVVVLNFLLERTYDQSIDKYLTKPMAPDIQQLLATLDTELIVTVLERALDENNLALVLPTVDILGQRGEIRAARPNLGQEPRALVRALYYPDRRVQWVALNALLRMPSNPLAPVAGQRIVDMLRRFLAADAVPKAMMVHCPKDKTAPVRTAFKAMGFEAELATSLKETFEKLKRSADYDVLFIHPDASTKELPYTLTQIRADADHGRLPLVLLAKKENLDSWTKMAQRYPNTWVLLETFLLMPEELQTFVENKIKETTGGKLTVEERKKFARESMDYLWKMGRGEIPGYDVRHAEEALDKALRNEDMALIALEIVARFPGRDAQARLTSLVLGDRNPKLKMPALLELNRHIHKHGMQLDKNQIDGLKEAYLKSGDNVEMRNQLALVLGNLRTTPQASGTRLFHFTPQPPAAPPEKKDDK